MIRLVETAVQRQRLNVQGLVQGVGFRPFVYGLAHRYHLAGFVCNDSSGVTIEIEGTGENRANFLSALRTELPPLARIDALCEELIPVCNDTAFVIIHSQVQSERHALISPDTAPCTDCLHELFDPEDRRYQYPFINCTNCGPRFTIVQDVPYDREKTTMRVFPMCQNCQKEYENPLNRRFHAQPNACPVCGPQVRLLDSKGQFLDVPGPITIAAELLAEGAVLAIKGLGGYHLACDALCEDAVRRLRQRKHREAKPFALMVPDIQTVRQFCAVETGEEALLRSQRRPIVLLHRRGDDMIAPGVAPGYDTLGCMLPYTPLHEVLLRACACVWEKTFAAQRPVVLVMTSGNVSDEPIAYRDDDAQERLATIADGFLLHNRAIHMRCDDTVMRITNGGEQFLRRARGYVPEPLALNLEFPQPLLACGAHLKNTFCLAKGKQAFVSHHIGDLENLETLISFREGIEHFKQLFDIVPQVVAYDLHPEYLATKYALDMDVAVKIGVQHHHAHIASVMAEHGLSKPVIGIAADGSGYGTDGAIWGCEVMVADLVDFERVAHLAYLPLPGGEQAVRQPWRMGCVYLSQAYGHTFWQRSIPFVQQLERSTWQVLSRMIERKLNCPLTSSLGRLFDAVAAVLGVRTQAAYEGQAAVELEVLAASWRTETRSYPCARTLGGQSILNVVPLIEAIVCDIEQGVPVAQIARRFHLSIAEMLVAACGQVQMHTGLRDVALSGGVFQNRLLLEATIKQLEEEGFNVYINHRVPPNDGGLSLGQAAIAAARLAKQL